MHMHIHMLHVHGPTLQGISGIDSAADALEMELSEFQATMLITTTRTVTC